MLRSNSLWGWLFSGSHSYAYISAGPCLSGATRLGRKGFPITNLLSWLFFNIQSAVDQSLSLFNDQSAIDQPAVGNLLFAGLQVSKLVVSTVLLYPLDQQFTPHQVRSLHFGRSWKSVKFQCISNTPENHKNCLPRPPKVTKMRSQEVPKVVKITKILKKWNLMKTSIFTILLKG